MINIYLVCLIYQVNNFQIFLNIFIYIYIYIYFFYVKNAILILGLEFIASKTMLYYT